jgi:hypothetical protein
MTTGHNTKKQEGIACRLPPVGVVGDPPRDDRAGHRPSPLTGPLQPQRVRVSDRLLLHDLLDTLRRAECVAEQTGADTIEVYVPRAPTPEQARREVELLLSTWRARHPEAWAELADYSE